MQVIPRSRNVLNPVSLVEREHKYVVAVGEAVHEKLPDGAVDIAALAAPPDTAVTTDVNTFRMPSCSGIGRLD